ncbi:hypothetical protein NL676_010914 [Syzygium grande]|nr:hypothetical protein NL676_010914 [Syzygium grande]
MGKNGGAVVSGMAGRALKAKTDNKLAWWHRQVKCCSRQGGREKKSSSGPGSLAMDGGPMREDGGPDGLAGDWCLGVAELFAALMNGFECLIVMSGPLI